MSPLQIDHERSAHWIALSDPPWTQPLTFVGRIHALTPPDTLSLIGTGPGTASSVMAVTPVTGTWQSTLWSPAVPGTLTVRLQATWGTTLKTSAPFSVLLAHLGIQAPTQMIVGVPITLWAMGTGLPPGCQYYWKYINLGGQGTFSSTLTTEPWTVWTPTHEGGVCFWVGTYVPDEDGDGYWVTSQLAEGGVNPGITLQFLPTVTGQIESPDPNDATGVAIFTDGLNELDPDFHNNVIVEARVNPPQAGQTVLFVLEDPDDPTTDDPAVDPNGPLGNDNRGVASLSAGFASTNAQGYAYVTLTVSEYPGDNYLVRASTTGARAVLAVSAEKKASEWRRLWVEEDSMGVKPSGVTLSLDDTLSGDIPEVPSLIFNFNQVLKPTNIQAQKLISAGESESMTPWIWSMLFTDLDKYALTDDLLPLLPDVLPGPYRQSAYVRPAPGKAEKSNFWSVYLLEAYEFSDGTIVNRPHSSFDNDPNTELGLLGFTTDGGTLASNEPGGSAISMETIRDMAAERGWDGTTTQFVQQIVAIHELLHSFGLEHHIVLEGGRPRDVMWAPTANIDEVLIPLTFLRLVPSQIFFLRDTFLKLARPYP